MEVKELSLLACPYCGRPAKLYIDKEISDTSRLHTIKCSYLYCASLSSSLSGYSPSYRSDVLALASDWNAMVSAILARRAVNKDVSKLGVLIDDISTAPIGSVRDDLSIGTARDVLSGRAISTIALHLTKQGYSK